MLENFSKNFQVFYTENVINYIQDLIQSPGKIILFIIDILIVFFLVRKIIKIVKNTRTGQLLKGIVFLILITILSGVLGLKILNYILTSVMTYGVIILIVIFQPELRRGLEQLGSNGLSRFLGFDKEIMAKSKENIYKIVIAAKELSKMKVGGLIVIQKEIKIEDIIATGIQINAEVSPQLLVNLFTPNTPLHDGAVIISDNKVAAAACMLPLANSNDIAKELGTRHRAAIGMSKESDAIVVVISEETGKISVAKDGQLYADLDEETLKKILIKNLIVEDNRNKEEKTNETTETSNNKD